MAKKPSKYWKQRFSDLEASQHSYAQSTFRNIEPSFDKAQAQIQSQIETWYARYASNNGISMQEARKQLTAAELKELQWDVQDYIKYGRQNAIDGQWMKELENASARYHVSRLQALQIRTQQALEVAYGNELDEVDGMMKSLYQSGYYHTCFEVQSAFGLGWEIGQIDEKKLSKVVSRPWATDGKNFSDRIWSQKTQMVNSLHQQLTRAVIQGKAPDDAIKELSKYVKDKTGNAKVAAGRLVMTESAFISSAAQKDAFKELGVEQYEIVATLDSHTSEICQEMDGQVFDMKDYDPGSTAPPFHPWCRSCTAPYFDDEWGRSGERAAKDEEGKTYYVPADMKYPDWKSSFVDGHTSDLKPVDLGDTIKAEAVIEQLDKLKQSGMPESDYDEYLAMINGHGNADITRLYAHADEIAGVKMKSSSRSAYTPGSNSLTFNYDSSAKYPDMNKYGTLAHEYGHFFDAQVDFDDLHYVEMEAVQQATGLQAIFKKIPSSSDEFLAAVRADKEFLKTALTDEAKKELLASNASSGVQDAIDGLFTKSRLHWGHGEKYYNRKYADLDWMDKHSFGSSSKKKALQQVYKDLGMDASNQAKTKSICRQYEAASEMWANITSAETVGGEELEFVKKYLPNSYQAFLKILKGVK